MLPIDEHRKEIIDTIRANQVTVVVGETGSGKTTLLPQMMYNAGFCSTGIVGITEPRRIAATSVAKYVAKQLHVSCDGEVGYQVRFDAHINPSTKVKFMTDGILLRELQNDPVLSKYSVIMIDEAHERSQNIDFTFGLLKEAIVQRPELKVVVSSATIDTDKFSRYFGDAPVIEVSGRTYPVEILWDDVAPNFLGWAGVNVQELVDHVTKKVVEIHRNERPGDILVFMTGADDITKVTNELEQQKLRGLEILPIHGGLTPEEQQKIFGHYPGKRKVIIATNIAETSITIDGVVYVIDSGLIKQSHFHPESGIQSLDVVQHSQAGCNQRMGRAGRTQPGKCFRLYSEFDFQGRAMYTQPEILRKSLSSVVLTMEYMRIENIKQFDFIDSPDAEAFSEAYETLVALGAVKKDVSGLTAIGAAMAHLPLEPRVARMVIEAQEYGCVEEVVTIAAFLSVWNVFMRPKDKSREADGKHYVFKDPRSDALTFLKVWREYKDYNYSRKWCFDNFLNGKTLLEIKSIRSQLVQALQRSHVDITSTEMEESVMKSVAAGLVHNLMRYEGYHVYDGIFRNSLHDVFVHPGSSTFGGNDSSWIVAAEVVRTTKQYARCVSEVKVEWLPSLAPEHFALGEICVTSDVQEDGNVSAVREIIEISSGRKFGSTEILLTLEAALYVQDEALREAHRQGLISLVFEDRKGYYSWENAMIATHNGRELKCHYASKIRPIAGGTYYCEIVNGLLGDDFEANVKLRVFDLPRPENDVDEKVLEIATESSVADMAERLQNAWGSVQ